MFLAKDIEAMIDNIVDKASVTIADTAAPHNTFAQPGMQLVLTEIAEFRAETNPAAVQALIKKLAARHVITDNIEKNADLFIKVSIE